MYTCSMYVMYIYVHIHVYVHMYIYVCTCVHVCIYICVHIVYMKMCVHTRDVTLSILHVCMVAKKYKKTTYKKIKNGSAASKGEGKEGGKKWMRGEK